MKTIASLFTLLLLVACAAQEEVVTQDTEQAVRDFIAVRALPEVDMVKTANDDHWIEIDKHFVVYLKRRDAYLFEFARRCQELDQYPIVPDVRRGSSDIHAKFDTLRGCIVAHIYALTEDEVSELQSIGESPGSRN